MRIRTTILTMTVAAMAFGFASCYVPVNNPSGRANHAPTAPLVLPRPGPDRVVVDSRWAYSATENRPAPEWLLQRAGTLIAQGDADMDRLVRRWPDVALELLRQSIANDADVPVRLAVAQSYDRVTGADPKSGWSAAVAASDSQKSIYASFRTARENILAHFQSGQFAAGAKINAGGALPADAPPVVRVEALRLAGLAMLLDNKPDRAVTWFNLALEANANGPRHQSFELGLLASEAHRRAGQADAAAASWKSAVAAGVDVRDPELWERALLEKPEHADWPADVVNTGAAEPRVTPQGISDSAGILIGLGKMYLSRGALQPALLTFSRAEAETTFPGEKALATLYRAQTMIALQQPASALPMLEGLLGSSDPQVARRAEALQGDIFCRVLNDHQHGIPMMREALVDAPGDWPGKSRLLANLGLYDIIDGQTDAGIKLLHEAQAQFETAGQWEDLAESLKNEAASLQVAGRTQDALAMQNRADNICLRAGLPTGPLIVSKSNAAKIQQ